MTPVENVDVLAIGCGPFNLGLAALASTLDDVNLLVVDSRDEFRWHPGLMFDDATLQVSFLSDLVTLVDDRHYFPPYDAVPLVRSATLLRHPEIGRALQRLAGKVDAAAMRRMNYAVDGKHQDPAAVVRAFLDSL